MGNKGPTYTQSLVKETEKKKTMSVFLFSLAMQHEQPKHSGLQCPCLQVPALSRAVPTQLPSPRGAQRNEAGCPQEDASEEKIWKRSKNTLGKGFLGPEWPEQDWLHHPCGPVRNEKPHKAEKKC